MSRNFLVVVFVDLQGNVQQSQTFATLRAARSRARWLAAQSFARDVRILRGGIGGEVVA